MCYTIQQLEERIIKQGQRKNAVPDEIEAALRSFREQIKGKPLFAVSGFDHPSLPVLVSEGGLSWHSMHWGLIPHWCRSWHEALELMNMTLNARSETIFEKPAFSQAVRTRRGLLPITGFYEYKYLKHYDNKTIIKEMNVSYQKIKDFDEKLITFYGRIDKLTIDRE